jgi:Domain of Unknown Function (DUF326)
VAHHSHHTQAMIETYPASFNLDVERLADSIHALLDCAQSCTACADACLREDDVEHLRKCIRLDLDCADVCDATMRVMSRQVEYDANLSRALVEACRQACRSCGDECERHAEHHEHCRICAEACRRCESACNNLLSTAS